MDTKKINLFVYDTKDNFEKSKRFLGEEGSAFKKIVCIENSHELDRYFETDILGQDEYVYMVVHVFAFEKINGIKRFKTSGIRESYPLLGDMFISDGIESDIMHLMVEEGIPHAQVYKYHQVYSNLRDEKYKAYTKGEILDQARANRMPAGDDSGKYPQINYAVITALFRDEFEELTKIFDFPEDKQIKTETKIFYRGYLISNRKIEIVAAIPNATGMVDTSIIATQMLEFFRPKYLLMSGVCGGAKDLGFGDIVLAKQIFTFQKGKVSDIRRKDSKEKLVKIDLFDQNKKQVEYDKLFDADGQHVAISVEKFEVEHDSIIPLNSRFEDSLNPKLDVIKAKINKTIAKGSFFKNNKEIDILVEPMACSTMVINKEGYFQDTIKVVHRKTAAVEMESYAVARACHFANNGKTIPIIFKSVMDHTSNKADYGDGFNFKKFAAFTSAQFMKELFDEGVI